MVVNDIVINENKKVCVMVDALMLKSRHRGIILDIFVVLGHVGFYGSYYRTWYPPFLNQKLDHSETSLELI